MNKKLTFNHERRKNVPFFRLEGFDNTCTFEKEIWFHREDGYFTGILKGFAREESYEKIWKKKNPQWCDIWSLYYWIWNCKFLISFGKVVSGFSIKKDIFGKSIDEVFILTRNAITDKEISMHQRHPLIIPPKFNPS